MRQNGFAVIAAIAMSPFRLAVTGHCYMSATNIGPFSLLFSSHSPLSSWELAAGVPATASLPLHIPIAMRTTPSEFVFIKVSFLDTEGFKPAILEEQPFRLKRRTAYNKAFEMVLNLNFGDGCGCSSLEVDVPIDFTSSTDCFNFDKDVIFQKLRDKAINESKCGQNAVIERKTILTPRSDITTYAVVTNVVHYSKPVPNSLTNGDHKKRKDSLTGTGSSRKRSKVSKGKSKV
ncbi:hypothetical protein TSUD_129070 [Trifolium subterraneum]|uniref:Uncharacterized protein n=1 Tax=Trifolium subterraneum TaxID=3900 RepID=A0A2Z6NQF1_TRISU|nr:hypothetical protein TSUD_129070 [Trifolium subterraneum]